MQYSPNCKRLFFLNWIFLKPISFIDIMEVFQEIFRTVCPQSGCSNFHWLRAVFFRVFLGIDQTNSFPDFVPRDILNQYYWLIWKFLNYFHAKISLNLHLILLHWTQQKGYNSVHYFISYCWDLNSHLIE